MDRLRVEKKIRVKGPNGVEFDTSFSLYEKYKQYLVQVADVEAPEDSGEQGTDTEVKKTEVQYRRPNKRGRKS